MNTKQSKQLSYILRHNPSSANIILVDGGWADTNQLITYTKMSLEELENIVNTNDKKRFEFNNDKTLIRARQGHSVEVDLKYKPTIPPDVLYHGTSQNSTGFILTVGIEKMDRHHVHLSSDIKTALKVGSRHGKPFVFVIDTKRMSENNKEFFKTENDVWLTEFVSPDFLIIKRDVDDKVISAEKI